VRSEVTDQGHDKTLRGLSKLMGSIIRVADSHSGEDIPVNGCVVCQNANMSVDSRVMLRCVCVCTFILL